jgi:hypothetical protein
MEIRRKEEKKIKRRLKEDIYNRDLGIVKE